MATPHPYVRTAAMKKRLEEMRQQMRSQQKDQDQDQDQDQDHDIQAVPASPSLPGLPVELRTYILELAVSHEPTGGIIAPLPDNHKDRRCMTLVRVHQDMDPETKVSCPLANEHWSATLTPGFPCERFKILKNGTPEHDSLLYEMHADEMSEEEQSEVMHSRRLFQSSPVAETNHSCTMDCLLQPAVTTVSRQMREEALRAFYSVNRFHIELENFSLQPSFRKLRDPTDWWRGIEDTNLRLIRYLSLAAPFMMEGWESLVLLACNQRRYKVSILKQDERTGVGDKLEEQKWAKAMPAAAREPETALAEQVGVMEVNGLHVGVLERVLASLEMEEEYEGYRLVLKGVRHLRDRSGLGEELADDDVGGWGGGPGEWERWLCGGASVVEVRRSGGLNSGV